MKLTDTIQRHVQHVCVYGAPKTGKSTLAAQLAEAGFNLIWISVDNGHDVLYNLSRPAQERVELVAIPDTKDFPVGFPTALKIVSGGKTNICDAHGQVECSTCKKTGSAATWTVLELNSLDTNTIVVWDTGTHIAESALAYYIKKITAGNQDKIDEFQWNFDTWRTLATYMSRFLTAIQQARYNTIVIAHASESKMEDGKKKLTPSLGTGNFSSDAGGYFDHLIYCIVRNGKHQFYSKSTALNDVVTGSRSSVFIEDMVNKKGEPEPSLVQFFKNTSATRKVEREYGERSASGLGSRDNATISTTVSTGDEEISSRIQEREETKIINIDMRVDNSNNDINNDSGEAHVVEDIKKQEQQKQIVTTQPSTSQLTALTSAERAKATLARLRGSK